jgi:hypothetical protein
MDFQFWLTLIIVVVTIIVRVFKSAQKKADTTAESRSNPDYAPEKKPMSFDELLREIQAAKNPEPQPGRQQQSRQIQQSKPIQSYEIDYDDDLKDEEQDLETIPKNEYNRSYEVYEKAKTNAFSRKSLEETMKLEDVDMNFSHFKGYEEAQKPGMGSEILRDFKDPEGFKKAFIMSEILKRKF